MGTQHSVALDFETWYNAEYARLVNTLALVTGDRVLATDAASEACTRALARWRRVSRMERPGGWIYQVALNEVRRRAKHAGRERRLVTDGLLPITTIVPPLHTIRADAKRLRSRRLMTGAVAAVALLGITGGAVAALSGAGQPAQLVSASSGSAERTLAGETDVDSSMADEATGEESRHSALCTIAPDGDLAFGSGMPFVPDFMDDGFDIDRSGFASGHVQDGLDDVGGAMSLTVTKVAGGTAAALGGSGRRRSRRGAGGRRPHRMGPRRLTRDGLLDAGRGRLRPER